MRNGKWENESIAHLVAGEGLIERMSLEEIGGAVCPIFTVRRHSKHRDDIAPTSILQSPLLMSSIFTKRTNGLESFGSTNFFIVKLEGKIRKRGCARAKVGLPHSKIMNFGLSHFHFSTPSTSTSPPRPTLIYQISSWAQSNVAQRSVIVDDSLVVFNLEVSSAEIWMAYDESH